MSRMKSMCLCWKQVHLPQALSYSLKGDSRDKIWSYHDSEVKDAQERILYSSGSWKIL